LVRAEFLHYDLGKQTLILNEATGLAPVQFATMQFTTRGDLVRAGIDVPFAAAPQAFALASGDDVPMYSKAPPPVFSWTGFYAGAHGGAGWARKDWFFDGFSGSSAGPGPEGGHVATGGLAGGQIGYNYQNGNLVWGAEAQASWADLRGDNISLHFPVATGNRNTTHVDGLGTIAGRVGT
jgi:outer membrane immunogenic protein